jgi:hypothetical protein
LGLALVVGAVGSACAIAVLGPVDGFWSTVIVGGLAGCAVLLVTGVRGRLEDIEMARAEVVPVEDPWAAMPATSHPTTVAHRMRGAMLVSWLWVSGLGFCFGLFGPSRFGWPLGWHAAILLAACALAVRACTTRASIDEQGVRVRNLVRAHSLRWDEVTSISSEVVAPPLSKVAYLGCLVVGVAGRAKPVSLEATAGASIGAIERTIQLIRSVAPEVSTAGVQRAHFPTLSKGMRRETRLALQSDE